MKQCAYYVYIMANRSGSTLYTGITNSLLKRNWQHKEKTLNGFTQRYNVNKLVHYEIFSSVTDAIEREKQIKGWTRKKKMDLIKQSNPEYKDLTDEL